MQKLGVFWKIQDICYQMGTEIFKIEEEMTEKMRPKVGNPPWKLNRIHSSQCAYLWCSVSTTFVVWVWHILLLWPLPVIGWADSLSSSWPITGRGRSKSRCQIQTQNFVFFSIHDFYWTKNLLHVLLEGWRKIIVYPCPDVFIQRP